MAQHTGVIEAISHKYDKFAILCEEKWFNTKKEYAEEWPVQPKVGDTISWDDGGKKYLGKMKIIKQASPGAAPAAKAGPSGAGSYNVGVETGHASKLAMDMALKVFKDEGIGSKEFYTFWGNHTLKIQSIMTKLKQKVAEPAVEAKAADPDEVLVITKKEPAKEPEEDTHDFADADELF